MTGAVLGSAILSPSVFLVFFTITLSSVARLLQNSVRILSQQREKILQIWLLYDFYFFVYAYIMARAGKLVGKT